MQLTNEQRTAWERDGFLAIFFHDLTLHASLPNRSGKERRALILTYRDLSQPDLEYPSLPAAAQVRG